MIKDPVENQKTCRTQPCAIIVMTTSGVTTPTEQDTGSTSVKRVMPGGGPGDCYVH